VSFPNRKDSIALDFFESVQEFCKRNGHTNFELVVRLSQEDEKPRRWDIDYIKSVVGSAQNLKKVFVCGPPPLTETFEKGFEKLI